MNEDTKIKIAKKLVNLSEALLKESADDEDKEKAKARVKSIVDRLNECFKELGYNITATAPANKLKFLSLEGDVDGTAFDYSPASRRVVALRIDGREEKIYFEPSGVRDVGRRFIDEAEEAIRAFEHIVKKIPELDPGK